ncbi:hypothetical protein RJT34_27649 [Clitoria ternatea]|uniref:Uncharacterized protein n=1 Tax=Clitoria ternatea TaxID=43366 RepID=A0AAN9FA08_CLITE
MQELLSKKGEEALAIATTPSSCLSSLNSDDCVSLPPMQEIYAELLSKKAKIEEQLKEISLTLSGMEEQLGMLRPNIMSEPEALAYNTTKSSEDRATKIERLKSGFQICKPEGKFVWPNIGVSTPPNPVKPLAERRAVSTATLTHVTGPFSPPPLGTPTTSSTFLNNPTSLNLNHAPL